MDKFYDVILLLLFLTFSIVIKYCEQKEANVWISFSDIILKTSNYPIQFPSNYSLFRHLETDRLEDFFPETNATITFAQSPPRKLTIAKRWNAPWAGARTILCPFDPRSFSLARVSGGHVSGTDHEVYGSLIYVLSCRRNWKRKLWKRRGQDSQTNGTMKPVITWRTVSMPSVLSLTPVYTIVNKFRITYYVFHGNFK